MKCPHCGSRKFTCIMKYVKEVEYDEKDYEVCSKLKDPIGENDFECEKCGKNVTIEELVEEVRDGKQN